MTTKTDYELNRALAEKLEPKPEETDFIFDGVMWYVSPKKLWLFDYEEYTDGGDAIFRPNFFHECPAAMVALIEAMEDIGYWLEIHDDQVWFGHNDEPDPIRVDYGGAGIICRNVRDAAAKALELV